MTKWSQEAWAAARPVYDAILRHPFVLALADGTLPRDRFEHYLRQDTLYIENYSRVLANIASRLTGTGHTAAFVDFARDGIAVEQGMHSTFLGGVKPRAEDMSPACLLYTSLLTAQAQAPVEVQCAAVLPCFWVYERVGRDIVQRASAGNPYRLWIDTYADPAFGQSTLKAIEICDTLAEAAGEDKRRAMTDMFVLCTRMEWLFWDSAWNLEHWKI